MIRTQALAWLSACSLLGAAFAQSTVTVIATQDNTLYQDASGSLSNGAGSGMFVGVPFSGGARRAVVAFDLRGQIPRGSTVTGARLVLNMSRTISGAAMVDAHRVTQAWGEGASVAGSGGGGGGLAQAGDATWLHTFFPNQTWNVAGGDFAAAASSSTSVASLGSYTWGSTAAMVSDVQGWVNDPATNFGWLLKDQTETVNAAKRFSTREDFNPATHPRLVIDYMPPQASVTSTGTGCGTAVLTTTATGLPTAGNAAFDVRITNGVGGNPSALYASSGVAAFPFPLSASCNVYLDFALVFSLASQGLDASGQAIYPFPIPNDTNLLGGSLAVQGVALELGFESGVTLSNALTLVVGV